MIKYLKARSAARKARAAYHLAVLETLIRQNDARLAEIRSRDECPFCKDIETAAKRRECEQQFS